MAAIFSDQGLPDRLRFLGQGFGDPASRKVFPAENTVVPLPSLQGSVVHSMEDTGKQSQGRRRRSRIVDEFLHEFLGLEEEDPSRSGSGHHLPQLLLARLR